MPPDAGLHRGRRQQPDSNQVSEQFSCSNCGASGSFRELVRALETGEPASSPVVRDIVDTDYSIAPIRATRAVVKTEPRVVHLGEGQRVRSQGEIRREAKAARKTARQGRHTGEKIIITLLALVFLGAGLAAAGLSGFANYSGLFQLSRRPIAVWRLGMDRCDCRGHFLWRIYLLLLALCQWPDEGRHSCPSVRPGGGGTSIVGTQMYIAANNRAAEAELVQAGSNRDVLEMQITDWRRQLEGIPLRRARLRGWRHIWRKLNAWGVRIRNPIVMRRTNLALPVAAMTCRRGLMQPMQNCLAQAAATSLFRPKRAPPFRAGSSH